MKLKEIINDSTFLMAGTVSKENDVEKTKICIDINKGLIKQCKDIVIILNKSLDASNEDVKNIINLYKENFKDCIILYDPINRREQFGHIDLDKIALFFIRNNLKSKYFIKIAQDILITQPFLDLEVEESDFYYLPAMCITQLYSEPQEIILNHRKNLNYIDKHPYPQTWFYILSTKYDDVYESEEQLEKCFDLWVEKGYKKISKNLVLAAEHSLQKFCMKNNIKRHSLLSEEQFINYMNFMKNHQIGDGSMKNVLFTELGILHWHYKNNPTINI